MTFTYKMPRYLQITACVWYGYFSATLCSNTKHNEGGYKWQPATPGTCDKIHLHFNTDNTNVARLLTVRLLLTWPSSKRHPLFQTGGQFLNTYYSHTTSSLQKLWVLKVVNNLTCRLIGTDNVSKRYQRLAQQLCQHQCITIREFFVDTADTGQWILSVRTRNFVTQLIPTITRNLATNKKDNKWQTKTARKDTSNI